MPCSGGLRAASQQSWLSCPYSSRGLGGCRAPLSLVLRKALFHAPDFPPNLELLSCQPTKLTPVPLHVSFRPPSPSTRSCTCRQRRCL